MNIILIIVGALLAIFLLVILVKHLFTSKRILDAFRSGSVMVSGRKRYGKGVLFQYVISKRKEKYFCNIDYGGDYRHIDMKEMLLGENTYHNFINGEVVKCDKNKALEGHDIYIDDGGVYLPSQADSYLHKIYPSLPITYALSGHMWANGIHVNTQRLDRVWKALREQADYFILMRKKCLKLPFFIVLFTTEYTKYESALRELSPMKSTLFNKYSKAEKDLFKANNGFVKDGLLIVSKRRLKYDTRAFHEVIYGEKAPTKEGLWKRLKKNCSDLWKKIGQSFKRNSTKSKSIK